MYPQARGARARGGGPLFRWGQTDGGAAMAAGGRLARGGLFLLLHPLKMRALEGCSRVLKGHQGGVEKWGEKHSLQVTFAISKTIRDGARGEPPSLPGKLRLERGARRGREGGDPPGGTSRDLGGAGRGRARAALNVRSAESLSRCPATSDRSLSLDGGIYLASSKEEWKRFGCLPGTGGKISGPHTPARKRWLPHSARGCGRFLLPPEAAVGRRLFPAMHEDSCL